MRLVVPLLNITLYALAIILVTLLPINLLNHIFIPHSLVGYFTYVFAYIALSTILFLGARRAVLKIAPYIQRLMKEKVVSVGCIQMHIPLVHGVMHGEAKAFHKDGSTKISLEFDRGIPHGKIEVFDENGVKRHEGRYVRGVLEGETFDYWADGSLFMRVPYIKGKREGVAAAFNENGGLITKCNFVNDKIEGEVRYLLESGVSDSVIERMMNLEKPFYSRINPRKITISEDDAYAVGDNFVKQSKTLAKSATSTQGTAYRTTLEELDEDLAYNGRLLDHSKDGIYVNYVDGKIHGTVEKILNGRVRWRLGFQKGMLSCHFESFDANGNPHIRISPHQGCVFKKGSIEVEYAYMGFLNGKCTAGINSNGEVIVPSDEISSRVTPYMVDAYAEIYADSLFNFSIFRPSSFSQKADS